MVASSKNFNSIIPGLDSERQRQIKFVLHVLFLGIGTCLWVSVTGCSNLSVSGPNGISRPTIMKVDKAVAQPGDMIELAGERLSEKIKVTVGGEPVELQLNTNTNASFVVPDLASEGLVEVVFSYSSIKLATIPLVIGDDGKVQNISEDSVCDDTIYRKSSGEVVRGTKNCRMQINSNELCSEDGQIDCWASSEFPVVDKVHSLDGQTAKIHKSLTIAGVTGSLEDCAGDGQEKCVTDGVEYRAAKLSGFTESDIRMGLSVAGVSGMMLDATPRSCSADGDTDCLSNLAYPAVDKAGVLQANASKIRSSLTIAGVAGGLNDCSTDGAAGCVVVGPNYVATSVAGAAAKIVSGQTVGGIAGSALSRPSNCSADGATDCVAVVAFPAIDKTALTNNAGKIRSSVTLASVTGTLDDCSVDGGTNCVAVGTYPAALAAGAAAKILTGQTVAGISGSAAVKPADCSSDGSTNCVAVASYPAVDKSALTAAAAKIHNSLSIASVSGSMTDCAADGGTNCIAVAAYPAALASGAAAKISNGQTLAGINGSAPLKPADCAADGSTNCVAVTNYPSVDKSALTAAASKIHNSLSIASVSGSMTDCAADGSTNCMAVAAYPSALAAGAAAKIANGQTLAGVSGTAPLKPADCAADGATNCVAVANYPSVDKAALTAAAGKIRDSLTLASVAGTLADCASDGGTNCVSSASYPAALAAGAASKVVLGQTLAGISGSAAARPSDCAADGSTGCVAVTNYPAVDLSALTANAAKIRSSVTLASVTGTLSDCSSDGDAGCVAVGPTYAAALVSGAAAKILTGQSVAGINGSAAVRPSDCAVDGGTNCVAIATFPAANASIAAAKIVSGQVVAGVTGTSAGSRPSDCATDAETNCVAVTNFPAMQVSGAAAKIALGDTLGGVVGTSSGTRPSDCNTDGDTGCVAVAAYPAVDKSALTSNAAKIRSGTSVVGVAGSLADCSADGATTCVAVVAYPAALASGAAAKILTGQTLAGVNGSAAARPSDCASDGSTNCVAVTNYPAVDKSALTSNASKLRSGTSVAGVAGSLADCANDGEAGCVVLGPTYAAALLTGAAAKIADSQVLAGVTGSALLKPADCSSDGGTNCVAVANYPAVDKSALTSNAGKIRNGTSIVGVAGSLNDCSADGGTTCVAVAAYPAALASGAAAKILTGQTLAGVNGSAAGRPADCASEGSTDCVAVTNYPAVDKSTLTSNAGKIRSGTSVAGVAGSLGDCSADGGTTCVAVAAYPAALASGAAAKILTGQTLAGVNGSAAGRPSDCASDGSTNCVAVANYPAVDKSVLTANVAKIRSSVTLASVSGTLGDCANDGEAGCVVLGPTYAAALLTGAPAKISNGQTLAGVAGTAPLKPADCSSDGGTNCVAIAAYPAALFSGAAAKILTGQTLAGVNGSAAVKPADCSSDGGTNCVAVTSYPSVDKSALTTNAVKVRSGTSIAGVSGSLADCAADGGTTCVAVTAYPAALLSGAAAKILTGQTLAGVNGSAAVKPADCSSDGGTNCVTVANFPSVDKVNNITANAAKIRSSVTIAGVAGTLADCSGDNGTNCVAVSNYPSVVKSNVTAGVIKSGTVIAGVTGAYPNATYVLSGADSTADLDSATFNAKIKAATAFEWFDSTGTRYTGTGDADISAANIVSSIDIFGTTGSVGNCTSDGQTACLTTSIYKSANTSAYTSWDIRAGKTVGGIAGSINFYKSMAKLTTFNRTSGTGSSTSTTAPDVYDLIDDYNNNSSMPNDVPAGWTAPGSNWLRDSLSDSDSDSTCNGAEACIYHDQLTGLLWAKADATLRTWENAISYCAGLNYGGYTSGWRLPSQKELLQAYVDGIWEHKTVLGLINNFYWMATSKSADGTAAWYLSPHYGNVNGTAKTNTNYVICVH